MASAASLLLLLGSILLAAWHRSGRRSGWAAETAIAVLALATGLFLGRSLTVVTTPALGPSESGPAMQFEFGLTPWSWAVLVCVLAIGLARVLVPSVAPGSIATPSRPAWLLFGSSIALLVVAASPLAIVLAWTAVIAAQTWLVHDVGSGSEGGSAWHAVQGKDLASVLLVVAAFGLSRTADGLAESAGRALLAGAAFTRLWSVLGTIKLGPGWVAFLGFPTAASVLSVLAWYWRGGQDDALLPWYMPIGVIVLLAAALSGWLAATADLRARAWIVALSGLALIGLAAAPSNAEASLTVPGVVLVLAGTLAVVLAHGRTATRVGAGFAGIIVAGIPGLVGAVFLGGVSPSGTASWLGWVAVIGAGLIASSFWLGAVTPSEDSVAPSVSAPSLVAAALMLVLGVFLYFRLRGLVPSPSLAAAPVALALGIAGAWIWGRMAVPRRLRWARALRWPTTIAFRRRVVEVVQPVEALVRGLRDVLEGDASLLWAMVVVVVGFLLLQSAT